MPESEAPTPETPTDAGAKPTEDQPLGEPGLAALKAEREAKEAAEKSAKNLAKRVQELEDAGKSELQRQQDELDRTTRELADLTAAKNRAEVAADKGLPVALLSGPASTSTEDVAAFADALIQFRTDQAPRLHVAGEGSSPQTKTASNEGSFMKQLVSSE